MGSQLKAYRDSGHQPHIGLVLSFSHQFSLLINTRSLTLQDDFYHGSDFLCCNNLWIFPDLRLSTEGICPQLPLPPEEESPGVSSSVVRQAGRGRGRDHGGRLLSRPLPHRAEPAEEEKETEKQKKTTEGVEF